MHQNTKYWFHICLIHEMWYFPILGLFVFSFDSLLCVYTTPILLQAAFSLLLIVSSPFQPVCNVQLVKIARIYKTLFLKVDTLFHLLLTLILQNRCYLSPFYKENEIQKSLTHFPWSWIESWCAVFSITQSPKAWPFPMFSWSRYLH